MSAPTWEPPASAQPCPGRPPCLSPGTCLALLPQRLDRRLLAVNDRISRDERVSSNPVARLVFGDPVAFLPRLPRDSAVHSSKMWSCRMRMTVEHLRHVVEQRNGRETVPVLCKFLQKVRRPGTAPGGAGRLPAPPPQALALLCPRRRPSCGW